MRKPYLRIILFILAFHGFLNSALAQISNVQRQDQIIRNQQQLEEEEKRRREFEKIRREREQLEKQKKEFEQQNKRLVGDQFFQTKIIEEQLKTIRKNSLLLSDSNTF